jgi:hypothetical protein
MKLTSQVLNDFEQNIALKTKYAAAGSWGQRKIVFLPVVVLIFSAFALYFFYDLSKTDASYSTYSLICGALILIAIVSIALIQRSAKQQVLANIASIPVCVAKKVYGNDENGIYYCIYTTGSKRHDITFIDAIAAKIFNIDNEPDVAPFKREIDNLFRVKFASTNGAAVLLPVGFTAGEQVYQKQFSTAQLGPALAENDGKFAVLAFNAVSVPVLKEAL